MRCHGSCKGAAVNRPTASSENATQLSLSDTGLDKVTQHPQARGVVT
jgi:hypothetical protein